MPGRREGRVLCNTLLPGAAAETSVPCIVSEEAKIQKKKKGGGGGCSSYSPLEKREASEQKEMNRMERWRWRDGETWGGVEGGEQPKRSDLTLPSHDTLTISRHPPGTSTISSVSTTAAVVNSLLSLLPAGESTLEVKSLEKSTLLDLALPGK